MRITTVLGAVVIAAIASGCTSPEAQRKLGGGPGADVGNRATPVKMHEGSRPFWGTPNRTGVARPPLEPAQQARELSRP